MTRARTSMEDTGKVGKASAASANSSGTDKAKMAKIGLAVVALLAAGYLLARQFGLIGNPAPQATLEQTLPPETLQQMEEEKVKTEKILKTFKNKGDS